MSNAARETLQKVCDEFIEEIIVEVEKSRQDSLASIQSARRNAAEAIAKITETGERQAESVKRQIVGSASLEARNMKLRALERAVNNIFEEAMSRVKKVQADKYRTSLAGLIREGVQIIGKEARIRCSSRDVKLVSSILNEMNQNGTKLTLEDETIDVTGGVVLTSADGSVLFDNTVEARLERMRPALRKEVADLLSR